MEQHFCSCTNHRTPTMGKYECVAFVRGNVAYALDALPTTHVHAITGTPWAQATIYLCGTHHAQFINRKAININTPSKEDNTMTMNEEFDFHAARECSSVYRNMCPNKPMTVIHEYSEGYELSSGVCLECAMIARKTIANDGFTKSNAYIVPEEDTMNNDTITIGLAYPGPLHNVNDGKFHVKTNLDGAMLCSQDHIDWDDVRWEMLQEVLEAEYIDGTVYLQAPLDMKTGDTCPKCIAKIKQIAELDIIPANIEPDWIPTCDIHQDDSHDCTCTATGVENIIANTKINTEFGMVGFFSWLSRLFIGELKYQQHACHDRIMFIIGSENACPDNCTMDNLCDFHGHIDTVNQKILNGIKEGWIEEFKFSAPCQSFGNAGLFLWTDKAFEQQFVAPYQIPSLIEQIYCHTYYNTSKEDTMSTINTTITNNAIKENNVPNSPVPGSSDRGHKWIKCAKCSKEIGSDWYHANVADVRTCMGAAPAPVKMVFKTDLATGETSTNTDLKFFYDESKVVVFAKAKELRAQGYFVMKIAKATKGAKNWYVQYKKDNK